MATSVFRTHLVTVALLATYAVLAQSWLCPMLKEGYTTEIANSFDILGPGLEAGYVILCVGNLNPLKTEFLLNNIYKSSSYLTGNTSRLHYKAKPVNAVWGNSRCLL
jgi:hypothetical protein